MHRQHVAPRRGRARPDPGRVLLGSRSARCQRAAAQALRAAACAALAALTAAASSAQDTDSAALDELLAPVAEQARVERPTDGWNAEAVEGLANQLFGAFDPADLERSLANLRRCRDGLQRVGAQPWFVELHIWQTAWSARDFGRIDVACAEFRHGIATQPQDHALVLLMRVDLADTLQVAGCWREARTVLSDAASALEPRASDDEFAKRVRTEAIGRWYGIQGEIDLKLGLPERASARFAREAEWASTASADQRRTSSQDTSNLRWLALDHRLKLALAVNDFAGVDRELARAALDPLYADWTPDLTAQFNVHSGAARYERERRGEVGVPDAKATLESVLAEPTARPVDQTQARGQLLKLAVERGDWSLARELLDALRAASAGTNQALCGGDPEAVTLATFEARVRFETARDDAERRSALADLEAAFAVFLRAWSDAPDRAGGIAFLRYGERYLVLDELIRLCLAVDGEERGARRALQGLGDAQLLGSLAQEWNLRSKPLDEWLAPLVREGSGVLFVQPGRLRSTLFVIDGAGLAVHEVEAGWKLQELLANLQLAAVRAVHGRGERSAPPRVEADALADALLPIDVRARVAAWTHAWVIGDESFGHLGLELVPLDATRRLGDLVPISYVPSLPIAAELATRAAARGIEAPEQVFAGVVAAPVVTGASAARWKPAPLEIDDAVWRRWSDVWGGRWNAELGVDATSAALCGAAARGVDVLQVVVHGIDDVERDAWAGLLLAGDGGELWSDALSAAMPRLLLLAVCQVDARPVRRGDDGRAGWAGRFASAGSDCVVLTPFDLEVERALQFFELVQRALRAGESPASALVSARRELSRSGARAQDYLVYAWGAGVQPVVARSNEAGAAAEAAAPEDQRWRWLAAGASVVVVLAAFATFLSRKRR